MKKMDRREFVGSAAIIAVGARLGNAAPVMKTSEFPERLDLFNPVAVKYFAMFFKESFPIALKESDWARDHNPRVFEHTTMCGIREAFALTGILVESDPDAKISVMLDGEYILKAAPPAVISTFVPRSGNLTSLFAAKTPENVHAGLFLPNGTNICVFALDPGSARVLVTLKMALYTSKGR